MVTKSCQIYLPNINKKTLVSVCKRVNIPQLIQIITGYISLKDVVIAAKFIKKCNQLEERPILNIQKQQFKRNKNKKKIKVLRKLKDCVI